MKETRYEHVMEQNVQERTTSLYGIREAQKKTVPDTMTGYGTAEAPQVSVNPSHVRQKFFSFLSKK